MGNRIAKYIYSSSGTLEKSIFYVRDASGNVMFGSSYSQRSAELEMPIPQQSDAGSVYENIAEGGANILTQTELHIYGSSRLGLVNLKDNELIDVPDPTDVGEFELERDRKSYELSNHLGNVLSIVTDKKIPIPDATETTIEFYTAVVISYTDYYPFGAPMAERSWQGDYRYGFNGKELDSEGMGGGSSTYDYGFRIYNPALGKFLSVDPLFGSFPFYTPYQFAGNRPIIAIDADGLEDVIVISVVSTQDDCAVKIESATKVLDKPGQLGHGLLNIVVNLDKNQIIADFDQGGAVIVAQKPEPSMFGSILSDASAAVDEFFNPTGGFHYSSDDGVSTTFTREGTGEEITDMDALVSAVSGMHAACGLKGNPLLKSSHAKDTWPDLSGAFDQAYERITGIAEAVVVARDTGKSTGDIVESQKTIDATVNISTLHHAINSFGKEEHFNIDADSLGKLQAQEGTKQLGNGKTQITTVTVKDEK